MDNVFAQNLRYLRQEKGLTQSQLAEILHYTQSNICEWEKGSVEPKAEALIAISNYFNVSTDYLLGLEDEIGGRVSSSSSPMAAGVTYSDKEMALIEAFRKLMPETQDFILRTAQSLNERDKKGAK